MQIVRTTGSTSLPGPRSFTLDARGNLSAETRPGTNVTADYDGYGRLTSYARSGAQSFAHGYNGLDDRVSTATTSAGVTTTRRFVYDMDGRVLGEYGASAAVAEVKAEFIWLLPEVSNDNQPFGGYDGTAGYAPLAVSVPGTTAGSTQLTWVHGNHLGVHVATLNASGTAITPSGYSLPGYPGQSQTLVDLYYNRYRDYDPTTGRYIQADPIGLAGDVNPYLYANGNPVTGIDPMGLQSTTAPSAPGVPWDAGMEVLSDRITSPSRRTPWGRYMIIGDVIGTGAAIAYYGYINPPGQRPVKKNCEDENDDWCVSRWMSENAACDKYWNDKNGPRGDAVHACQNRAQDRLHACKKGQEGPQKFDIRQWRLTRKMGFGF